MHRALIPVLLFLLMPIPLIQAVEIDKEVSFTIGGEVALTPRKYRSEVTVYNPALGGAVSTSGDSDVAFRIGAAPSLIVMPNDPVGLMMCASVGVDHSSEDGVEAGDTYEDSSTGAYANLLIGPSVKVGQRVRLSVLGIIGGSAGSSSHTLRDTSGSTLDVEGDYSGFEYGFRFQARVSFRRVYIDGFIGYLRKNLSEDGEGNFDAGQGFVWNYNGQRLAPVTYKTDSTISGLLVGVSGGYAF